MSPADVLPRHYKARRVIVLPTGCWLWCGSRDGFYGHMRVGDRTRRVHRVAYEVVNGPIPEGLQLDHLCRVELCCNPRHLEPVTALEHNQRLFYPSPFFAAGNAYWRAKTHCPRNHAYDERNTGITKRGARICRACAREKMRARRAAQVEAHQHLRRAA